MYKVRIVFSLPNSSKDIHVKKKCKNLREIKEFAEKTADEYPNARFGKIWVFFGDNDSLFTSIFPYNPGNYLNISVLFEGELKDYNEPYLLTAPISPPMTSKESAKAMLTPVFIKLPRENKHKNLKKYFSSKVSIYDNYEGYGINVPDKVVSIEMLKCSFGKKNLNYCQYLNIDDVKISHIPTLFLLFMDLEKVLPKQIPNYTSETISSGFTPSVNYFQKTHCAGAIRECDREEYEKQYKEACVRIIDGFQSGEFRTSHKNVKRWVKAMKQLIEEERKENQSV